MTVFRVPTEKLADRCVYLMDDNPHFRFAVFNKDKATFLGLNKSTTETTLEEADLDDPENGRYGEVVPLESSEHLIPDWIELAQTVNTTGFVWEENRDLIDHLRELEENPDWPTEVRT